MQIRLSTHVELMFPGHLDLLSFWSGSDVANIWQIYNPASNCLSRLTILGLMSADGIQRRVQDTVCQRLSRNRQRPVLRQTLHQMLPPALRLITVTVYRFGNL
jgi:hypothetical protein